MSEDLRESLESSVHNEEPEMFDSMTEFETYLMDNSHLEFGYLWTEGSGWFLLGLRLLKELVRSLEIFPYESTWNGFHWLVTSFVREGRKTVERFRDRARDDNREGRTEYDEYV